LVEETRIPYDLISYADVDTWVKAAPAYWILPSSWILIDKVNNIIFHKQRKMVLVLKKRYPDLGYDESKKKYINLYTLEEQLSEEKICNETLHYLR